MRSTLLLASLFAAMIVAAPNAASQVRGPTLPISARAAPLPAALAPAPKRVASNPPTGIAPRSTWRYPRMGLLAGVVVGAAFGTYVMATADEWMAPPAHILTVPAGALLGLAGGGVANLLDPP